jgi:hypothetical protein
MAGQNSKSRPFLASQRNLIIIPLSTVSTQTVISGASNSYLYHKLTTPSTQK